MLLNDAPFARICKSISSSSADQIVELFGAPVRTISTPLPTFARSDKSRTAIGQIMATDIPKTTAYRLGSRTGARRIGSVTTPKTRRVFVAGGGSGSANPLREGASVGAAYSASLLAVTL